MCHFFRQDEELQKAVAPNIPLLPAAFQALGQTPGIWWSEGQTSGRLSLDLKRRSLWHVAGNSSSWSLAEEKNFKLSLIWKVYPIWIFWMHLLLPRIVSALLTWFQSCASGELTCTVSILRSETIGSETELCGGACIKERQGIWICLKLGTTTSLGVP